MKKFFTFLLMTAAVATVANAQDYTTAGDGTDYTFSSLAQIEGSGVTSQGNKVFDLTGNLTIAAGDNFTLEDSVMVRMAQDVQFTLNGTANFEVDHFAVFTKLAAKAPSNIFISDVTAPVSFKNVTLEYAGIKVYCDEEVKVDACNFRYHDGSTKHGSGAISLGGTATVTVTNCHFEYSQLSAIAGAANSATPLTVENCFFYKNGQAGRNYPQVNLTVASQVIVRNNVVVGDRNKRNVGGIVVSNLMGAAKDVETLIEGNTVRDARYGISVQGSQKAKIINNTLVDNNVETNPNYGGSGINITDNGGTQETVITGNYIKGHLWGVTVVGGKNINLGKTDDPEAEDYNPGGNIFVDNGNNGVLYDLYNNSANTVYAQGNLWNVKQQTYENIAGVIFDKSDSDNLGEVIYWSGDVPVEYEQGDVNRDGTVNGSDVTKLYNILLDKEADDEADDEDIVNTPS